MPEVKTLAEELEEKRGLVLRYASAIGSSVSVHIQTPHKVFDDPADGTKPYVDIFEGPMQEALKLLDNEE